MRRERNRVVPGPECARFACLLPLLCSRVNVAGRREYLSPGICTLIRSPIRVCRRVIDTPRSHAPVILLHFLSGSNAPDDREAITKVPQPRRHCRRYLRANRCQSPVEFVNRREWSMPEKASRQEIRISIEITSKRRRWDGAVGGKCT